MHTPKTESSRFKRREPVSPAGPMSPIADENENTGNRPRSERLTRKPSILTEKSLNKLYTPESVTKAIRWRIDRTFDQPLSPHSVQFLADLQVDDTEEELLENDTLDQLEQHDLTPRLPFLGSNSWQADEDSSSDVPSLPSPTKPSTSSNNVPITKPLGVGAPSKWVSIAKSFYEECKSELSRADYDQMGEVLKWCAVFVIGFVAIVDPLIVLRIIGVVGSRNVIPAVENPGLVVRDVPPVPVTVESRTPNYSLAPDLDVSVFNVPQSVSDFLVRLHVKHMYPEKFKLHRNPKVCLRVISSETHIFVGCVDVTRGDTDITLRDLDPRNVNTLSAVLLSDMKKFQSVSRPLVASSSPMASHLSPQLVSSEGNSGKQSVCETTCTKTCTYVYEE